MAVTIMPRTVRKLKLTDLREVRKYLRNGANQVIKRKTPWPEAGISWLDAGRRRAGRFAVLFVAGIKRPCSQQAIADSLPAAQSKHFKNFKKIMNDNTPITVGEYQEACAAARRNLDPKLITFLSAHLAGGTPTPTTLACEPGDKLFKVFGIVDRLDKLEVHLAAADLKGEERMVAIFDAEEKNKTRGAAPKTVIGPSKFGRFRNDDNSVNLASVFDSEAEVAKV